MRPVILHPKGVESDAYLVDLDSLAMLKRRGQEGGEKHPHYMAAASIAGLNIGDFEFARDAFQKKHTGEIVAVSQKGKLIEPRPCVLMKLQQMEERPIGTREILPEAARVLLQLAEAANNATSRHSSGIWEFGDPVERDPKTAVKWSGWGWFAAWLWSFWQKHDVSTRAQWEEMKRLGYPNKEGSLRTLITDKLGLVPASREEAEQNPWNRSSEA